MGSHNCSVIKNDKGGDYLKTKYNRLLYTAAIAGLLAAAAAAAGFLISAPLQQKAMDMADNLEKVNAFVENPWKEPFLNEAAALTANSGDKNENTDSEFTYSYISPEGIQFLSQSAAWNEEKLQELYQELLLNKHGEELDTLSYVLVYPQDDEYAAATHQNMVRTNSFSLNYPALPEDLNFTFNRTSGVITLYGGDRCDTVESMASSLSHEYGHHFTFYHMFGNTFSDEKLLHSEYTRLRNLDPAKVQTNMTDSQFYYDNHHWYLAEIAAEDYVSLMGSPNSREIGTLYDIRDRMYGEEMDEDYHTTRNALVQENLMIPMASETEGLAEYFYSFLGQSPPDFPKKQPAAPNIQRHSVGYDFVDGYRELVSYELTWEKVYGEDAVYTLVSYQEEDYANSFYPIKTVYSGENASAYIGTVSYEEGGSVVYWDDSLAEGTRTFAVTAILPDGTMHISDPLVYTF